MPAVAVIVVAAGTGTRLGAGVPKAFVDLCGTSVLGRALGTVRDCDADRSGRRRRPGVPPRRRPRDRPRDRGRRARRRPRGRTPSRRDSRCSTPASGSCSCTMRRGRSPVPAQFERVASTVRSDRCRGHPEPAREPTPSSGSTDGAIVETVDRSALVHVQTPQGFPRAALVAAYATRRRGAHRRRRALRRRRPRRHDRAGRRARLQDHDARRPRAGRTAPGRTADRPGLERSRDPHRHRHRRARLRRRASRCGWAACTGRTRSGSPATPTGMR